MFGWKVLTHDYRSPFQGGDPPRDGNSSFPIHLPDSMRNSCLLIGNKLGILSLPLLVGPFVGALAEALHLSLPWIYEHCLWIGDWLF
jgi:hypothetical protein